MTSSSAALRFSRRVAFSSRSRAYATVRAELTRQAREQRGRSSVIDLYARRCEHTMPERVVLAGRVHTRQIRAYGAAPHAMRVTDLLGRGRDALHVEPEPAADLFLRPAWRMDGERGQSCALRGGLPQLPAFALRAVRRGSRLKQKQSVLSHPRVTSIERFAIQTLGAEPSTQLPFRGRTRFVTLADAVGWRVGRRSARTNPVDRLVHIESLSDRFRPRRGIRAPPLPSCPHA